MFLKKGNCPSWGAERKYKKDCGNYRGINVLSSMRTLYGRVLKKKLENDSEPLEAPDQGDHAPIISLV